jgi:AraC-like DNA-binding protein
MTRAGKALPIAQTVNRLRKSATAYADALAGEATAPYIMPDPHRMRPPFMRSSSVDRSAFWSLREEADPAQPPSMIPLPDAARAPAPRKPSALAKWRLARAVAYIDAHLGRSLRLADIAASAGLSDMHFAAQFRAATGYRPRDYVLRRRIARAQHLLSTSSRPLVHVALDVGFQTQAHFTTVFKRITGETPAKWRAANYRGADLVPSLWRRGLAGPSRSAAPQR